MLDYYKFLGISRNSTKADIIEARFKKYLDLSSSGNVKDLSILKEGYEILMNENSKTEYDRTLRDLESSTQSNNMKDYYSVLGVSRYATTSELLDAKVRTDQKLRKVSNNETAILLLKEAYMVLSDKELRKKYDLDFERYTKLKRNSTPDKSIAIYEGIWKEDISSVISIEQSSVLGLERDSTLSSKSNEPILNHNNNEKFDDSQQIDSIPSNQPLIKEKMDFSSKSKNDLGWLYRKARVGIIVFCVLYFIVVCIESNFDSKRTAPIVLNYLISTWFVKRRINKGLGIPNKFWQGFLVSFVIFILQNILALIVFGTLALTLINELTD